MKIHPLVLAARAIKSDAKAQADKSDRPVAGMPRPMVLGHPSFDRGSIRLELIGANREFFRRQGSVVPCKIAKIAAPASMQKVVYSSDELPSEMDDDARFSHWNELCTECFCEFEQTRVADRPFTIRFEFAQAGVAGLSRYGGGLNGVARTRSGIAADGSDEFSLCINSGHSAVRLRQNRHDIMIAPGDSFIFTHSEAWAWQSNAETASLCLNLPQRYLLDRVRDAQDLFSQPLRPDNVYLRHLWRYIDFLLGADGIESEPGLQERVDAMLADLLALALGAHGESAEVARSRGLRGVRLQEVLRGIRAGFSDPAFSSERLALRLGLSRRYINDLLFETGTTFSERVLEMRLQKARAMLMATGSDGTKVSDIALTCGFNEVSYFNRCFRKRFGCSPTQYRSDTDD